MQIKRFEAADMTEALRMVKREFGDDAVILSAKEARPRGFFSALKKKHVEITAATDYSMEEEHAPEQEFTGLLAEQLEEVTAADRVSLSRSSQPQPPSSPAARETNRHDSLFRQHERANDAPIQGGLRAMSRSIEPAEVHRQPVADCSERLVKASGSPQGVLQSFDPADWIVQPFFARGAAGRIIAVVGPAGAGKSTTLAKLAWHCQKRKSRRVGLISLDRYHLAANAILQRIAQIMDLPFQVAHDGRQIRSALTEMEGLDYILIDTPGMGPADTDKMDHVRSMLRVASPDETHLVVNGGLRQRVLDLTMATFAHLQPNRLLPTHVDECPVDEVMADRLRDMGLTTALFSDGTDLYDDLKRSDAHWGGQMAVPSTQPPIQPPGRVAAFPQRNETAQGDSAIQFVANRNSELFHRPECKSVKRIHAANVMAFTRMEAAVAEGFKPCRACCDHRAIQKSINHGVALRHAGAM